MSVVKINALTVPPQQWDVIEQRFAARAGEVDDTPGFESFQLLRPTDDSHRWFVVTQWESEEAFDDWMTSREFQQGHRQSGDGRTADAPPADGTEGGSPATGEESSPTPPARGERPAATGAELLSFEVVQASRSDQAT